MKFFDGLKFVALTAVQRIAQGVGVAAGEISAVAEIARNQLGNRIDAEYNAEHPEARLLHGKPDGSMN